MKSLFKTISGITFAVMSFTVACQSANLSDVYALQAGSVEEMLNLKERDVIQQNSLKQDLDSLDDCDKRFPYPLSAQKNDPYGDKGSEICKKLKIRGQRMQCEVDALLEEKPTSNTTGAKIELAAWARCNIKVANLLIDGYYLPASEIERRLQICSSNYYADPGRLPKLGWYQRFLKWYTSNDLTPPPSDASLEVALKQSTPLDSRQDSAGLMKCEWMFNISRIPQVEPLPISNNSVESNPTPKAPAKKSSKK